MNLLLYTLLNVMAMQDIMHMGYSLIIGWRVVQIVQWYQLILCMALNEVVPESIVA